MILARNVAGIGYRVLADASSKRTRLWLAPESVLVVSIFTCRPPVVVVLVVVSALASSDVEAVGPCPASSRSYALPCGLAQALGVLEQVREVLLDLVAVVLPSDPYAAADE